MWCAPARTTTGCGLPAGDYFFGRTWSDLPGPIPACRAQVWRRRVGRNCRSAHYSHQTRPRLMNLGWELGLGNSWPKTHDSKNNRPSAIRTSVISSPISDLRPPTSPCYLLPAPCSLLPAPCSLPSSLSPFLPSSFSHRGVDIDGPWQKILKISFVDNQPLAPKRPCPSFPLSRFPLSRFPLFPKSPQAPRSPLSAPCFFSHSSFHILSQGDGH